LPIWTVEFLARTLPAFEILLGITLASGRLPRLSGSNRLRLLLIFFDLTVRALAQGKGIIPCGCFEPG
jgi:hypothetical protein